MIVKRDLGMHRRASLKGYAWKEARSAFKHVSKSWPDLHGRRLYSDKSIAEAQYLVRVAYRAWKGRALPQGRSWGHVRSALLAVYKEFG